jgi:hypothetical protein
MDRVLEPSNYTGRAREQVDRFVEAVVEPIRARYGRKLAETGSG